MAELVLSTIGRAIGARVAPAAFQALGQALGQAGGAYIGRAIDQRLFGETRRFEGARLTDLHIQGSSEGASIPAVYGRVRIAGQVIWAARFKEHAETVSSGGGKGGGARATATNYRYTLSFAVGLCAGEISRIGRVWANGEAFDMSAANWRVYVGSETQAPDPVIEAIEGADNAPAYRGLAYIVFEDLPLESFGNVIPQFSFEVMRPAPAADAGPRLEERVRGVCMIPGSGEFVYSTAPVRRVIGPGQETLENVHAENERANLLVALDQLEADLPNCARVMLVVSWFGDDLRCAECDIRPGVEIADKVTSPASWRAGAVDRGGAHVVSQVDGAPAFGGTPSDASVIEAITELKARGFEVGVYPFILMDVPAGNALPDPYGGAEQAAYPWRGRISVHPAAGEPASPDQTSAAGAQVAAFFGTAEASDFSIASGQVNYSGPSEWSYRRFILHHAKLAQAAGGVDFFVIGSEMRALTQARDSATSFPAVEALQDLLGDVRGVLGSSTMLTYAADWSEYFGHQPNDGSGDVYFHLDPLWANSNMDVVGIDWYPRLTDWREGTNHLDYALARDDHDPDYLLSRTEAGEDYDWYYANEGHRDVQTRSTISDGAYSEPWIYRAKDVRNFWARAHYNRPGGVRAASPTAWVAESKPIWFTELGVPAIDKGANAPNLFLDVKSSESATPPYSSGARDDLIQRRALEAYLKKWDPAQGDNPTSSIYGGPMIDPDGMFIWAWDARPFPAYPARADVWADGDAWRRGHWLSGRAGLATLADVVGDICVRAGLEDFDVSGLSGAVSGYVADHPSSARAALEPLMAAFDFQCAERAGVLTFFHSNAAASVALTNQELAGESAADLILGRDDGAEVPIEARVRFVDPGRDYLIASASARRLDLAAGGVESLDAPLALEPGAAEAIAQRILAQRRTGRTNLRIALGPAHTGLEPGDQVTLDGGAAFEIVRIEDGEARRMDLRAAAEAGSPTLHAAEPNAPAPPISAPSPALSILDLPPLPNAESDERPLAAVFASPWSGTHEIYGGPSADALSRRGQASSSAVMGELVWALWPGPVDRWDEGNVVRVRLYGGSLASATRAAVLNGANAFAVRNADGEWEIMQAAIAALVSPNEYDLSAMLRGRQGSGHAMGAPHPAGTRIVALDQRLARLDIASHEWGEALSLIAPPAGAPVTDVRASSLDFTLAHNAVRPWAPRHVRAERDGSGDVRISWVRCARIGGDAWGAGEPPLGVASERYVIEIMDGEAVLRSAETESGEYVYSAANQSADFGAPPSSIRVRAAQIGDSGAAGLKTDLTITL